MSYLHKIPESRSGADLPPGQYINFSDPELFTFRNYNPDMTVNRSNGLLEFTNNVLFDTIGKYLLCGLEFKPIVFPDSNNSIDVEIKIEDWISDTGGSTFPRANGIGLINHNPGNNVPKWNRIMIGGRSWNPLWPALQNQNTNNIENAGTLALKDFATTDWNTLTGVNGFRFKLKWDYLIDEYMRVLYSVDNGITWLNAGGAASELSWISYSEGMFAYGMKFFIGSFADHYPLGMHSKVTDFRINKGLMQRMIY